MSRIAIIVGSTRPNRFGIQPAQWIYELASARDDAEFTLVDLQEENLPLLDEPVPPAYQQYTHDHTKNWASKIDGFDGFIMVTPEYNHGVPASLKNAIDFAAKEWNYKPVAFVSYGAEAGGTRAVEQLRMSVAWLRMYDLSEQVLLQDYWTNTNGEGEYQFTDDQVASAHKLLDSIVFWTDEMKQSRQKLSARKE